MSRGSDKAALQYTFIGISGQTPLSLRQAWLQDPAPALLNKLFDTLVLEFIDLVRRASQIRR